MKKRLASIALALTLSIGINVSRIIDTDNNGSAITSNLSIAGSNLDSYYITEDKTVWDMQYGTYLVQKDVTIDGDVTVA